MWGYLTTASFSLARKVLGKVGKKTPEGVDNTGILLPGEQESIEASGKGGIDRRSF